MGRKDPDLKISGESASSSARANISDLMTRQNADGGWGFAGRDSWTEPTAFVLLALPAAEGSAPAAVRKALDWLEAQRRSDGGWSPHPTVRESTWVSALAAVALHRHGRLSGTDPVLPWLLKVEGAESGWLFRARRFLLGGDTEELRHNGWPWFPGSAAWVVPTALTILALREIAPLAAHLGLAKRIEAGRQFLLNRRCSDGGWNHGSSRALGYHGDSYPETTGLALLALRGIDSQSLRDAHQRARHHFQNCRSVEAWSWLQMGLRAHGIKPPDDPPPANHELDAREAAIYHMASFAIQGADPWAPRV